MQCTEQDNYRKSPTAESEFFLVFFFDKYLSVIISPFSADMNHCEQELGEYLMGNPSDMMLSVSSLYSSWKQSVELRVKKYISITYMYILILNKWDLMMSGPASLAVISFIKN